ncbi:YqzG/YhdC family protein [Oceanobacillus massiliensis]|uniref:YqzG/YhdC family protein n=1 Tax=Oceanobacillus massiliensis TaxID=1465765 RepID=UPI000287B866|nr:YqzG/YhdC family protein [Oceanobacillus massiliensis]
MWKLIMGLSIAIFFIMTTIASPAAQDVQVQETIPSYAKWGRLAVQETKAKYANAKIVDYLHVGKETKDDTSIEKFKLWLNEGDREFGVFIHIEFDTETEKVQSVTFEETDR